MSVGEDEAETTFDEHEGFRVPRVLRAAEVLTADGERVRGRLFLPAAAQSHPGTMRADEWMNDPTEFFPFLPDGEGSPVVLGKQQTVMVTVSAADDRDDNLEGAPVPMRRVRVECGAVRVEGNVAIDLPAEQSRVLDFLNQDEAFVTIRDGEVHHLVRKSHVTRVTEAREPEQA